MAKPASKTAVKKSNQTKHTKKAGGGKGLKPTEQKVLDLVAGLKANLGKEEASRKQIFSMAAIGKSTFANALTTLKNEALLVVTPATLTITAKGMDQADPESLLGEIAMTNEDHHQKVKDHHKLKAKACALIDELADGKAKNSKETATKIGLKMNSTFANLKTDLKKKEIVVFDRDTIQLHDEMFPFGRPE